MKYNIKNPYGSEIPPLAGQVRGDYVKVQSLTSVDNYVDDGKVVASATNPGNPAKLYHILQTGNKCPNDIRPGMFCEICVDFLDQLSSEKQTWIVKEENIAIVYTEEDLNYE